MLRVILITANCYVSSKFPANFFSDNKKKRLRVTKIFLIQSRVGFYAIALEMWNRFVLTRKAQKLAKTVFITMNR